MKRLLFSRVVIAVAFALFAVCTKVEGGDRPAPGPDACRRDSDCRFEITVCPRCPPCEPEWRRAVNLETFRGIEKARSVANCPLPMCPHCARASNLLGVAPACRAGRCRAAGEGISFFYTDLDGTLLDDNERISPRVFAALEAFRKAGGKVGIATGRMPDRGLAFARKIGAELPLVFANGAVVTDPRGKPIRMLAMDDEKAVETVCQLVKASGCDEFYTGWGNPKTGEIEVGMNRCGWSHREGFRPLRIRARRCRHHKRLLANLGKLLGGNYLVLSSGKGKWLGISVSAPGTGKEKALQYIASRLGTTLEHFAYAGDGQNDVEALRLVDGAGGMCFAMKNAHARAGAACPRKTASDNNHGGVADALLMLLPAEVADEP